MLITEKITAIEHILATLCGIVIAVMTVLGYLLVKDELRELVQSNRLTEKALRQNYRPFGGVAFAPALGPDTTVFTTGVKKGVGVGEFRFEYELEFKNSSSALLVYIGSLTLDTTESLSFHDLIISGVLDTSVIVFDKLPGESRRLAMYRNDQSVRRSISVLRHDYTERIYVYTLFLYEDQDGNLYDTEHLDRFPFKTPKYGDSTQLPSLDTQNIISRDQFNVYTRVEVDRLRTWMKRCKHPMANFFPD